MANFPKTIHFTGLNTPVGIEWSARNLDVIGDIPAEVDGAFFRAVPDPAVPPMYADDIVLSGDGMVARFAISGGKVDYAIRYVETERYKLRRGGRCLANIAIRSRMIPPPRTRTAPSPIPRRSGTQGGCS